MEGRGRNRTGRRPGSIDTPATLANSLHGYCWEEEGGFCRRRDRSIFLCFRDIISKIDASFCRHAANLCCVCVSVSVLEYVLQCVCPQLVWCFFVCVWVHSFVSFVGVFVAFVCDACVCCLGGDQSGQIITYCPHWRECDVTRYEPFVTVSDIFLVQSCVLSLLALCYCVFVFLCFCFASSDGSNEKTKVSREPVRLGRNVI